MVRVGAKSSTVRIRALRSLSAAGLQTDQAGTKRPMLPRRQGSEGGITETHSQACTGARALRRPAPARIAQARRLGAREKPDLQSLLQGTAAATLQAAETAQDGRRSGQSYHAA